MFLTFDESSAEVTAEPDASAEYLDVVVELDVISPDPLIASSFNYTDSLIVIERIIILSILTDFLKQSFE